MTRSTRQTSRTAAAARTAAATPPLLLSLPGLSDCPFSRVGRPASQRRRGGKRSKPSVALTPRPATPPTHVSSRFSGEMSAKPPAVVRPRPKRNDEWMDRATGIPAGLADASTRTPSNKHTHTHWGATRELGTCSAWDDTRLGEQCDAATGPDQHRWLTHGAATPANSLRTGNQITAQAKLHRA
ncbi:hypothetical protein Purlil1_4615 [Purpureocillium lilacinum]|uniref:Uncharacterized protein n=1 Tax=Purpureocillium lilacinum TaxID=33203 RepID=A0ABR0C494_PURLI|nr:hypothetical protein Purlil1_4615 [Purpureocillium lilacinum]